jgi:glycosyltransferase involved in cell wall biosynthesis
MRRHGICSSIKKSETIQCVDGGLFIVLNDRQIICFAPSDWWGMNPSCTTHIMRRLAVNNKTMYVNPFSSDISAGIKKGIWTRLWRKIKSVLKVVRQPCKNLYVFSPAFFPMQGRPWIDWLNNQMLYIQFRILCKILGFKRPILWIENLRSADLIPWFDFRFLVYHVSDLFTQNKYTSNWKALEQREEKVLSCADLVVCVSDPLYKLQSSKHKDVHYVPHGVDYEKFRHAVESGDVLPELHNISHPIAGYFGTMTGNNDIDLLRYCAEHLPSVSFVFAGQITGGDYGELLKFPNVHYLGRLPYDKIPLLCAGFDVCMLQWRMSDWIRNCNPLKLQEYMASGRPIVSIPIREIENKYSHLISVAQTKEEYCSAIQWEIENDTSARSAARIEIARQHGWDYHVEEISQLIENGMRAKSEHCMSGCRDNP